METELPGGAVRCAYPGYKSEQRALLRPFKHQQRIHAHIEPRRDALNYRSEKRAAARSHGKQQTFTGCAPTPAADPRAHRTAPRCTELPQRKTRRSA